MTAVDDRDVLTRIAAADRRAVPSRDRWTALAVGLATFLLVAVLGVGAAYVQASAHRQVAWNGMDFDAYVQGPTAEQIAGAADLEQVSVAGLRVGLGELRAAGSGDAQGTEVADEESSDGVDLYWSDPRNWEHQVLPAVDWMTGTYPTGPDEVVLSERALETLGIPDARPGDRVTLTLQYRGQDTAEVRDLALTGVYRDQTTKPRAYAAEAMRAESGVQTTDTIVSFLYLSLHQPYLDAGAVADLSEALGIERDQTFYADDTGLRTLLVALAAMAAVVLLVCASAALVVHALLTIWLDRQVRTYGLLAAVGATSGQLRRVLRRQVARSAGLGILAGAAVGALVVGVLVPRLLAVVLDTPGVGGDGTGDGWVLVVVVPVAGLLILATCALSARGPLRAVATASPVEAMEHVPAPVRAPRDPLGRRHVVSRLAGRALTRDRRRTAAVVTSFVLALTATLVGTALVASHDTARVLEQIRPDLVLTDRTEDPAATEHPLDQDLAEAIATVDGVAGVRVVTADPMTVPLQDAVGEDYYTEFFDRMSYQQFDEVRAEMVAHPESFAGSLVGIDDEALAELNSHLDTPVDVADFRAGRAAVLSVWHTLTDWPADRAVGQDLTLVTPDGTEHRQQITAVTTDAPLLPGGVSPDLLVSAEHAANLLGRAPTPREISVDYQQSYDQATEDAVLALVDGRADVGTDSMIDALDQSASSARRLAVLGLTAAGVLVLVALVGFATTVSAAVHARAREHAMLEAVGATGGQLRRAVVLEGLLCWAVAAPVSVALAWPIGAAAFRATDEYGTAYTVPVGVDLAVLAALAVVCTVVPLLALRGARRGDLTDRLRIT